MWSDSHGNVFDYCQTTLNHVERQLYFVMFKVNNVILITLRWTISQYKGDQVLSSILNHYFTERVQSQQDYTIKLLQEISFLPAVPFSRAPLAMWTGAWDTLVVSLPREVIPSCQASVFPVIGAHALIKILKGGIRPKVTAWVTIHKFSDEWVSGQLN